MGDGEVSLSGGTWGRHWAVGAPADSTHYRGTPASADSRLGLSPRVVVRVSCCPGAQACFPGWRGPGRVGLPWALGTQGPYLGIWCPSEPPCRLPHRKVRRGKGGQTWEWAPYGWWG